MQSKIVRLRPRTEFASEEVARFQKIQEELDQFNESLTVDDDGNLLQEPLPEPQYDKETFSRFRDWQQQTMGDKADAYRAANPL